jgi:hypothetical protein
MKVVCAQCLREGLSDFDNPTETTVYCERHQLSLKSAMAWQPFTGVRLLVVVAAGEQVLFDYLRRACSGMADVAVIMERRQGERRSTESAVPTDRRSQDRRQLVTDAPAPWYRYLRFGGGWVEERSREMVP